MLRYSPLTPSTNSLTKSMITEFFFEEEVTHIAGQTHLILNHSSGVVAHMKRQLLNKFQSMGASTLVKITPELFIDESEIKFAYIRSPGPGGQNVNKVASAVQLRFNIIHSGSLPENIRSRLIILLGNKLTHQGEIIIKATRYRTQEKNKQDAITRLITIIRPATIIPKKRKKTKPSKAAKQKRLTEKKLHAKTKSLRSTKPNLND